MLVLGTWVQISRACSTHQRSFNSLILTIWAANDVIAGLAARIPEYGVDVEYICSCSDGVLGRPSGVRNQHWRISETTYLSCPLINLPTALACRFVRCTTPSSVFSSFTWKVKYKKSANDQLVSLMASKMWASFVLTLHRPLYDLLAGSALFTGSQLGVSGSIDVVSHCLCIDGVGCKYGW